MKLSCIPICFFKDMLQTKEMSLINWLDMAASVGLDGIEMYDKYLEGYDPGYLEQVSDQVKARGLEVSMFTGYGDLAQPGEAEDGSPSPGPRAAAVAEIKSNVDAVLIFDANIVRVVAGTWPKNPDRDAVLSRVAAGLRECVAYARVKGVWLAFEDHPQVGTKIEDFVEIIDRVGSPDLKVNLDTSNPMVSGESAADLVELVKDRVVHVHASDRHANLEHAVAGEGAVDFPAIFRTLKQAGFDGWVSMEAGGHRGKQGIVDGLDYLRRVWADA